MNELDDVKKKDIFRDTAVRYLGYANEVGEAFRSQVHVNWVRASYAVASAYVCADAVHKGNQAQEMAWPDPSTRKKEVLHAVVDTLIWQGLASVIIPGFTINRICWLAGTALNKSPHLTGPGRRWLVTAIGLASIPLIIKPIDKSVDVFMERTLRQWLHIPQQLEDTVVHHHRND